MRKIITLLLAATALGAAVQPAHADTIKKIVTTSGKRLVLRSEAGPTPQYRYAVHRDLDNQVSSGRMCATDYQRGFLHAYGAWGYYIPGCATNDQRCPYQAKDYRGEYARVARCFVQADSSIHLEHRLRHPVTLNQRVTITDDQNNPFDAHDLSCSGTASCLAELGHPEDAAIVNPEITMADGFTIEPGQGATAECNGVRMVGPNTGAVACYLRLYWEFQR
jgi:hypothetical protein